MKDSQQKAQACVIWMHGLGADASDMVGLADQLVLNDVAVRHIFIDAPQRPVTINAGMIMPAWYDILGMKLVDREDKDGIEHSESIIRSVIESQMNEGFSSKQIFLAGFSQGGAMALHTALHSDYPLAGVIALSAYLPMAADNKSLLNKQTPFFIASGQFDPVVLPIWTQQSKEWLIQHGYERIAFHQYPMEHSICFEEIKDMSAWLSIQVKEVCNDSSQ